MHVLLLNQAFFPDVVATAQIAKDLADALVAKGHRVTVIASRSIYGQAGATLAPREDVDGIAVIRVGEARFGKRHVFGRGLDFAGFYAESALAALRIERPDVVVSLTTPPFLGALGLVLQKRWGCAAVQWVMDLYPDVAIANGVLREGSTAAKVFERLGQAVLNGSDMNVVLGRCMAERVLKKGVDPSRLRVIPVWSRDVEDGPVDHAVNPYRRTFGVEDKCAVIYSGNLGLGHDVATLCGAMERLATRDDVRFVFVGGGKRLPELEAFAKQKRLQNVAFFGYEPRARLAESLSAADVHLVSMRRGFAGLMVPSKLFGAMAAGRPVVFVGERSSEVARILLEHDAGVVIDEGDDDALAQTLVRFAERPEERRAMGARARAAFVGRYDARTACATWIALLEAVVSRTS